MKPGIHMKAGFSTLTILGIAAVVDIAGWIFLPVPTLLLTTFLYVWLWAELAEKPEGGTARVLRKVRRGGSW